MAQQFNSSHPSDQLGQDLTVSQALSAFTQTLIKKNNYVPVVRNYLLFTVKHGLPLGDTSRDRYFAFYSQERKLGYNITSPVRNFLRFALDRGIERVVANRTPPDLPATFNSLIRDYLSSNDKLIENQTKQTYARALNAYFAWLQQHEQSLSPGSVKAYLDELISLGRSTATVNLHLSAIKQLARWTVLQQPQRSEFSNKQVLMLHEIQYIRGIC